MPDRLPQSQKRPADPENDPAGFDSGPDTDPFTPPDEINILREKTFTPELRDLVARVIRHDSSEPDIPDPYTGLEDQPEEDIILRLHRLFYNTRNLIDNQDINTAFDPFDLQHGAGTGSLDDSVQEYIRDQMADLSFDNLAIFRYDKAQKCFLPDWQNLARYDAGSLMISLHDRLYKKLLSSPDGIILNVADIQNDPYLSKIFIPAGAGTRTPAYFILLSDIYAELSFEIAAPGTEVVASFLPSGLLMIELFDDAENVNPAPIANLLRKRLSVPFFIADVMGAKILSFENLDKLSNPYSVLEYYFNIFLLMPDGVGLRLDLNASGNGSMLFIMKYILSRLNAVLSADSALIQMVNESLLILTHRSCIERIRNVIDEYIGLFSGSLSLLEFQGGDFPDSASLIQKIVLYD